MSLSTASLCTLNVGITVGVGVGVKVGVSLYRSKTASAFAWSHPNVQQKCECYTYIASNYIIYNNNYKIIEI